MSCSVSGTQVSGNISRVNVTARGTGTTVLTSQQPLDVHVQLSGITTLVVDAPPGMSSKHVTV